MGNSSHPKNDIPCVVVIGASAGSFSELWRIVAAFPSTLPAAVLVVVHTPPSGSGQLARLLDGFSAIPSKAAIDGERLLAGRIYVAPPDHHLLVDAGEVQLRRTPRENGFRPAVDPLFRTAAHAYGERVVGVILSGALSDGALGLAAIKRCGGVAIVQDPADAVLVGMPESALLHVKADHVLPGDRIASELVGIVEARASGSRNSAPPSRRHRAHRRPRNLLETGANDAGRPSGFTCPECGGALWERGKQRTDGWELRCHVGHRFSEESLVIRQSEALDRAMWEAARSLEEGVALRRRMAGQMRKRKLHTLASGFEAQAAQLRERAETVWRAIDQGLAPPTDPALSTEHGEAQVSKTGRQRSERTSAQAGRATRGAGRSRRAGRKR